MAAAAASAAQRAAEGEAVRQAIQTQRCKAPGFGGRPVSPKGRPTGGYSPNRRHDYRNLSGTPSWALFETPTENLLQSAPLPPVYGGDGKPPGAREWEQHFKNTYVTDESQHLDELRSRLLQHLEGVGPQGIIFVTDLVLSQAHEIWHLKKSLKESQGRAGQVDGMPRDDGYGFEKFALEEKAEEWRNFAHTLAETNAELEGGKEKLEAEASDHYMQAMEQDEFFEEIIAEAKYVKLEMAEFKRRELLNEDRAIKLERMDVKMHSLQSEQQEYFNEFKALKQHKKTADSEVWSMRLAESALRQECSEFKQEIVNSNEGLARRVAYERLQAQDAKRAVRDGPGLGAGGAWGTVFGFGSSGNPAAGGVGQTQRLLDLDGTGAHVPIRDPSALFDAFASTTGAFGSAQRLRVADFGHLCESLRRAEGRGPSSEEERRGFAEFAFAAVFGSQVTEVDKSRFIMLFDHFAHHLVELEIAFVQRGDSLSRPLVQKGR